ncbi:MAG: hypothetical protein K9G11_02480 [Rickettsiaceae bacterium]|nr:hypothetical protein [Rickettsiaceae bacterium]
MLTEKLKELWLGNNFPHAIIIGSENLEEEFLALGNFIDHIYSKYSTTSFENNIDVMIVSVIDEKKTIAVDQIRALSSWLNSSAATAPFKFAIINNSDMMNNNAANACLKILEEPPGDSYLILLANNINKLPLTVLSRCYKIRSPSKIKHDANVYQELLELISSQRKELLISYCNKLKSDKELFEEFINSVFLYLKRWLNFASNVQDNYSSDEYKVFLNKTNIASITKKTNEIMQIVADANIFNLDGAHTALVLLIKLIE